MRRRGTNRTKRGLVEKTLLIRAIYEQTERKEPAATTRKACCSPFTVQAVCDQLV